MNKFIKLAIVSYLAITGGTVAAQEMNPSAEYSSIEIDAVLEIKMDALLSHTFFQNHTKKGISQRGFVVRSDREKNSSLQFLDSEIQRRFNVRIFSSDNQNLDVIQSHCGLLALEALEDQKTFVVAVKGLSAAELNTIRTGRIVLTKGSNGELVRRRVIELSLDVAKDIDVKCSLE